MHDVLLHVCLTTTLLRLTDSEDSDLVVTVSSEQGASVSRPGQRKALGVSRVLSNSDEFGLELINDGLALQVENW